MYNYHFLITSDLEIWYLPLFKLKDNLVDKSPATYFVTAMTSKAFVGEKQRRVEAQASMTTLLIIYSIKIKRNNEKHPLVLILRSWSRPWARSWARLWAGGRAFLPRLGTVVIMWGWGAGSRFGNTLLFPILNRWSRTTARLFVTGHFLGSTARVPLWLHFRTALGPRLRLSIGWTRSGLAGSRTRFWFMGSRTRPAVARLSSRPGPGITFLVATRTRPVKNNKESL